MAKSKRASGVVSAPSFRKKAGVIARDERAIQRRIDTKEKAADSQNKKPEAMQAGARRYPVPPLPGQHLEKPGLEADLDLKPMYDAPHYKDRKSSRTWSP